MKNFKKSNSKGFTIIEVLIVLAIAGLILLVVFLAVPALQRNARNTSRKSDVSRVLGATQEVINNNGGQVTALTGTVAPTGATLLRTAVGSFGYYTAANVTTATAPAAAINSTTEDTVIVYTAATCSATGGTAIAGTSRQVAVTYTVEPTIAQCTSN